MSDEADAGEADAGTAGVGDAVSAVVEARHAHVRALAITSTASLAGVAAAVASSVLTAGVDPAVAAGAREAQVAVLVAVIVQLPVYQVVFDEWGGAKDTLYVAFMTFIMWFITWGVILTSGARVV